MGLFDHDFQEFIKCLNKHEVDYVLIGGHAVNLHGRLRITEDLDIFINPSEENAQKIFAAIDDFGFDLSPIKEYLKNEKKSFEQFIFSKNISLPTNSGPIELLGRISGISSYSVVKNSQKRVEVEGIKFSIISLDNLIKNKLSSGREKDIEDAKFLSKHQEGNKEDN